MFHRLGSEVMLFILALLLITANLEAQTGFKSEDELIRSAEKYFNEKNYEKAFPLFSQIVSNRPDNSHYNYCLGVCIMNAAPDKAEAVRFLEIATKSPQNPSDSWLYLGQAYHASYHYEDAISAYENYKLNTGRSNWNSAKGDLLIKMCRNGIDAKNDLSLQKHRILEKASAPQIDFFTLYKNVPEAGKFLKLPKEYEDKNTRGSNECTYVFLPANNSSIVFSNAGKSSEKGFDIYKVNKDQKGMWLLPQALSDVINTNGDEAYPVVVNDGKTLYFSSKGEKSTGGYDIFRSDYSPATGTWSDPVSMGPPVNSPGDDFYYLPAADNKFAYFSSNRESDAGKCNVYKVAIINEDRNFITINGLFNCSAGLELSDAKVTIMNPDDHAIVAQFRTASQQGEYHLKLPVPSKFIYQVELAGFNSQQELVDLSNYPTKVLIQEILLVRSENAKEKMTISNRIPVDEKVVAGNKTGGNISISQNISERDMAMATPSSNKNDIKSKTNSDTSQDRSGNDPQNSAQPSVEPNVAESGKTVAINNPSSSSPEPLANSKSGKPEAEKVISYSDKTGTDIAENNNSSSAAVQNSPVTEKVKSSSTQSENASLQISNDQVAGEKLVSIENKSLSEKTAQHKTDAPSSKTASSTTSAEPSVSAAEPSTTTSLSSSFASKSQSQTNSSSKSTDHVAQEVSVAGAENLSTSENSASQSKDAQEKISTSAKLNASDSPSKSKELNSGSENMNGEVVNTAKKSDASNKTNKNEASSEKAVARISVDAAGNINVSEIKNEEKSDNGERETVTADNKVEASSTDLNSSVNTASEKSINKSDKIVENTADTDKNQNNNSPATSNVAANQTVSSSSNKQFKSVDNPKSSVADNTSAERLSSDANDKSTADVVKTDNSTSNSKVNDKTAGQNKQPVTEKSVTAEKTVSGNEKSPATGKHTNAGNGEIIPEGNSPLVTNESTNSERLSTEKQLVSAGNEKSVTTNDEGTPSGKSETSTDRREIIKVENENKNSAASINSEEKMANSETTSSKGEKRSGLFSGLRKKEVKSAPVESEVSDLNLTPEPVAIKPAIPYDVIFRVQLGAFKDRTADELKKKFIEKGLTDLIYVKNDEGLLLVMTGSEKNYETAQILKAQMISKGITDAFIVAYSDGSRLPLQMVVLAEE